MIMPSLPSPNISFERLIGAKSLDHLTFPRPHRLNSYDHAVTGFTQHIITPLGCAVFKVQHIIPDFRPTFFALNKKITVILPNQIKYFKYKHIPEIPVFLSICEHDLPLLQNLLLLDGLEDVRGCNKAY